MTNSKYLVILAIFTAVYIILLFFRHVLENSIAIIPLKWQYLSAEQTRLFALNEIVVANSDILPPRERNVSARILCRNSSICTPVNRQYETMLRVSPKYKMVNCVVPKSMSTMMTSAMCYLYNEQEYERSGRSFDEEFITRFCKGKNEFNSMSDVRDAFNISLIKTDWSISMITRNPIDRFVSSYVDRCVRIVLKNSTSQCNGCGLNMTCFIEQEYERLMKISYKRITPITMEDAHFFPQVWHCDLNEEIAYFEFFQYSSSAEDTLIPQFEDLMQRQNVPRRSIDYVKHEFLHKRYDHSTAGTPARKFFYARLMSSPYLLEYIVKMFYHDFIKFYYPFPQGFQ